MDRFGRLLLALVLLVLAFATPARAAEWVANSDFNVTVKVAKASEIPVPMPIGMVATVATGHRSFGIIFPNGKESRVYLGDKMMKISESSDISLREAATFARSLEGLKTLLMEAEKGGLSAQGIEFGLEPELKEAGFREVTLENGFTGYRLVGNFSNGAECKLALSALGSK